MNTLLFPMDRVVSMDEIDDYFDVPSAPRLSAYSNSATAASRS